MESNVGPIFSTDKFLQLLDSELDTYSSNITTDLLGDAHIIAQQILDLKDKHLEKTLQSGEHEKEHLKLLGEMSTIEHIITATKHSCKSLYDSFDTKFREWHGEGRQMASGIDAMRIISMVAEEAENGVKCSFPHVSHLLTEPELFGNPDDRIIERIYNDSFLPVKNINKNE